jgi:NTE family protein
MRALVLSGGGSRGAFQVGVLKSIINKSLDSKDFEIIAGVSAGAINALGLISFLEEFQDISKAVNRLEELWKSIKDTSDIYQSNSKYSLLFSPHLSLFDHHPLENLLRSHVDVEKIRNTHRFLRIGVWNVTIDKYQEINKLHGDLIKWTLASSSIPLILPPVIIDQSTYADGGIKSNIPHMFLSEFSDISEIDVIMTGPPTPNATQSWMNNLKNSLLKATLGEIMFNDLSVFIDLKKKRPDIKIRYYYPKKSSSADLVCFNQSFIQNMIDMGLNTIGFEL